MTKEETDELRVASQVFVDWAFKRGYVRLPPPEYVAELAELVGTKKINATQGRFIFRYTLVNAYFNSLPEDFKNKPMNL